MEKTEELELFLAKAEDLINSKYIVAEIKLASLLKAIASSETLLAIFKNCLFDFDYEAAKKKYLVKSKYLSNDKGEFILPSSSREILALVFNILVDLDAKRIDLSAFINKYFYEDGSFSAGYSAFINGMIKPFTNTVKVLIDNIVDGRLQDPVEAITEEEQKKAIEIEEDKKRAQEEKELLKKVYGNSLKQLREILLSDKTKIKVSKKKDKEKEELILIVDMLANVIESNDKDAINYAFLAYKYMVRDNKMLFSFREKKVTRLIRDLLNGI